MIVNMSSLPDQSDRLPAGPGLHCRGRLKNLKLDFGGFFLLHILLYKPYPYIHIFAHKLNSECYFGSGGGRAVWSPILESLLFQAFCFCSRKRSPAAAASLPSKLAHYQCQQRSTISSASKMVSDPGSHYFETLLLQFGNVADTASWETERREGIMLHKIGGCFLRLRQKRMENRSCPKQGWSAHRNCRVCFLHLPTWSREPPATLSQRYLGQPGGWGTFPYEGGPITAVFGWLEWPEHVWWCSDLHCRRKKSESGWNNLTAGQPYWVNWVISVHCIMTSS